MLSRMMTGDDDDDDDVEGTAAGICVSWQFLSRVV